MDSFEVRKIFMPYCLQRLKDGCYLFLNRKYKPLGVFSRDWVDYETHPSKFKFKRALSERQAALLSHKGDTDRECIYLYGDACIPTDSESNWDAYSARLKRLAAYEVQA